jgi:spermidine/putrescine transport system permease protein
MKNSKLAAPYVVWMALFVIVPLILVVIYAFSSRAGGFTLENFATMNQYLPVFGRSFLLALIATLICIFMGYPLAYVLAKEGSGFRRIAMMLIMLPMWMNFLLRTYSWMSILENTGLLNTFFQKIGLIALTNSLNGWLNGAFGLHLAENMQYFHLINTQGAIVLGMVYNFLPFMVLPIYTVIEKIDYHIIEAAQDLGANSRQVFRKVILPLSLPGVLSGITMVFVPSVSTFAIPRLLGGGMVTMLGDLIEAQFMGSAYNPYLGSAISLVMMLIVLVCMAIMNRFGEGEEGAVVL